MKNKTAFFIKKWILKGIPVEKLAMQNFIFTASIKYMFTYTTFLTAEDKQIWHNFINILLCSNTQYFELGKNIFFPILSMTFDKFLVILKQFLGPF